MAWAASPACAVCRGLFTNVTCASSSVAYRILPKQETSNQKPLKAKLKNNSHYYTETHNPVYMFLPCSKAMSRSDRSGANMDWG